MAGGQLQPTVRLDSQMSAKSYKTTTHTSIDFVRLSLNILVMFGKHSSHFPKNVDFIMCVLKNQEFVE